MSNHFNDGSEAYEYKSIRFQFITFLEMFQPSLATLMSRVPSVLRGRVSAQSGLSESLLCSQNISLPVTSLREIMQIIVRRKRTEVDGAWGLRENL